MPQHYTLQSIAVQLGGIIEGNAATNIARVASLAQADAHAITFMADTSYREQLAHTNASAVVLKPEHASLTTLPKILVDNPSAYFAKVTALLNPAPILAPSIHPSAVIDSTAIVPASCQIAAGVVIEPNVVLGEHVYVGAHTVLERGVQIGSHTRLDARVTVYHGCQIGAHCRMFSGVVIGADGFGYAPEQGAWLKIPQVGRVIIQNQVDIGANTTIDRGRVDDTVIEQGCKLDNQIHIGHNCRIGAHTVIAGCVGIAGTASIGKHCQIGGAAMILGHLEIADNVTISPGSMIMRSITQSGTYTAIMPSQLHKDWLKTAANIRQLDQLADKIKNLETTLAALQQKTK